MVKVDVERAFECESIYIIFKNKNLKLGVVDTCCNVYHQKYKKKKTVDSCPKFYLKNFKNDKVHIII